MTKSAASKFTFRNITGSLATGTDGSNPSPSSANFLLGTMWGARSLGGASPFPYHQGIGIAA